MEIPNRSLGTYAGRVLVDELPTWALCTLALRCAGRVARIAEIWAVQQNLELLPYLDELFALGTIASRGVRVPRHAELNEIRDQVKRAIIAATVDSDYEPFMHEEFVQRPRNLIAARAVHALSACSEALACLSACLENRRAAASHLSASAGNSAYFAAPELKNLMRRDFDILIDRTRSYGWTDETRVSDDELLLRWSMEGHDVERLVSERYETLLQRQFLAPFLASPSSLSKLSGRALEEFAASLLRGLGLDVQLTAASRDSGVDVIAVSSEVSPTMFLVECKGGRQRGRLPSIVRELHGTTADAGASKGILVTTSPVTKAAWAVAERHPWRLTIADTETLLEWIRKREILRMRRLIDHYVGLRARDAE